MKDDINAETCAVTSLSCVVSVPALALGKTEADDQQNEQQETGQDHQADYHGNHDARHTHCSYTVQRNGSELNNVESTHDYMAGLGLSLCVIVVRSECLYPL